jgi:RND family efflux transporter MFP subunit
MEYFVEYESLEPGKGSEFLVHVTRLETYKPCLEGVLTIELNGKIYQSEAPERPGIFVLSVSPDRGGEFDITYSLRSGGKTDSATDRVEVHDDSPDQVNRAEVNHAETEQGEVTYLKEQAWNNDFMVQEILPQPFSSVVATSGEILAVPGEKKNVAANSSGIITFSGKNLVQGSSVEKGQLLFTISANSVGEDNFELHYQEYMNSLNRSRSEFERHRELYDQGVISERQYIESRTNYISDSLRFYSLASKATADGLLIRAPASGYIHQLDVAEGQFVEMGQLLVTISSDRKLLLRADVPQQDFPQIKDIVTANFRTAYSERIYSIDELNGTLLAKGSSVAENDHYIPVYFEVQNDGTLLEGAFAEFYLITTQKENRMVVPMSALAEEQGVHYLYLQVTGESYTKRQVVPGENNGKSVEIISGLIPGDRIVTGGAMLLKAASMVTGVAGHSHEH